MTWENRVISIPMHMRGRKGCLYPTGIIAMVFLAMALVCGMEPAVAAEEQAGEAVQPEDKAAVEDAQVQGDAESIDSRRVMELRKKKVKGELTSGEQAYLDRAREERKQRARNKDSSQRETGKSRKQKGDGFVRNTANCSASAVMDFSPPLSSEILRVSFPGGRAMTSMPASSMSSASSSIRSALPPPKSFRKISWKCSRISSNALANFSRLVLLSFVMSCCN